MQNFGLETTTCISSQHKVNTVLLCRLETNTYKSCFKYPLYGKSHVCLFCSLCLSAAIKWSKITTISALENIHIIHKHHLLINFSIYGRKILTGLLLSISSGLAGIPTPEQPRINATVLQFRQATLYVA